MTARTLTGVEYPALAHPKGTKLYMKKPRSVYAVRFNPRQRAWPPSVVGSGGKHYVLTGSGYVELNEGDWVLWQTIKGKIDAWPVVHEIFEKTYELSHLVEEKLRKRIVGKKK